MENIINIILDNSMDKRLSIIEKTIGLESSEKVSKKGSDK